MQQSISDKSSISYVLRGMAIWSVIYAHSLNFENHYLSVLSEMLGLVGVPLFLICSGAYFKYQPWPEFWRKKINTLLLPWVIWGTFAYGISCVLGANEVSIFRYMSYLLGYKTWLYYVPVYFVILLIFNFIRIRYFEYIMILVNILSILVTYVFHLPIIGDTFTFYQNPFNFIGFFSLGLILSENEKLVRIQSLPLLVVSCIVSLFAFLFFVLSDEIIRYVHPIALIFEASFFVILLRIATIIKTNRVLTYLGKNSYIIYFLHMQIGISLSNKILNLLNVTNEYVLFILKPVLVIIVTVSAIQILAAILKILNFSRYRGLFGLAR